MNKSLEKTIFLFFVHEVLSSQKMALTWDGQYIPGQMIARVKGSFHKENGKYHFSSKSLTSLSKKYGLSRIEKVFSKPVHPRFDSVYRFIFDQKDLNMKAISQRYEKNISIIFAEPNYRIFSREELESLEDDQAKAA
jgi:hypothetical protein